MGAFLNISYKMVTKRNRIRRMKTVQRRLRRSLHIFVDIPIPNYGTTNTGKTRSGLSTTRMIGLSPFLLRMLDIMMRMFCSKRFLDSVKLKGYNQRTAELYHGNAMTPTLHKDLYHSPDVVQYFNDRGIAMGTLSEEPLDARNKHFRCYRSRFSRKSGRSKCLYDVMRRLQTSSDPVINAHSRE